MIVVVQVKIESLVEKLLSKLKKQIQTVLFELLVLFAANIDPVF